MSYVVFEDEMSKLLDVIAQLKLFSEMADQAKKLTLPGEGLGCLLHRLADDLASVSETAEERRQASKESGVSPFMLAQIISTLGGLRPILGSDENRITLRLRECADADEDMRHASTAWEEILTSYGGPAITTLEGFYVQFDKVTAVKQEPQEAI